MSRILFLSAVAVLFSLSVARADMDEDTDKGRAVNIEHEYSQPEVNALAKPPLQESYVISIPSQIQEEIKQKAQETNSLMQPPVSLPQIQAPAAERLQLQQRNPEPTAQAIEKSTEIEMQNEGSVKKQTQSGKDGRKGIMKNKP